MESQVKQTLHVRYPEHLKGKTPIINLPLYNTDQSLFTFFLVEETSNLRKTATCKCCEKKIEFIPGSTVFSSYTLILKSHLQSHPEQFNLYLELLAKNMKPDNKTKFQHFCRMEYPALLPKPERERRWDESRLHEKFVLKNLAGVAYEKNDYYSKQNFKGGFLPKTVDGENVKIIEYIYQFTNRNVPLYELVGTWNVNNRLDRRYLRYRAFLQNTGNLTLDLERLLCENTCFLDPENYETCPNNHSGDISIFGDREFQQKIKNLDDELEKYPEFMNNKSFNSIILKEVGCIQKDSEALLEMNRLLKIILSMITVKIDSFKEFIEEIIQNNTSEDRLVKPHFAIQLWGPMFVDFDEKKNKNTKAFSTNLFHTYQHVDNRECSAYNDDSKIVLIEPMADDHGSAIYPCNVGGCRKHCDCAICNFSGDNITECSDHYPDHPNLFNEDEDITIKKRIFFQENKRIEYERPFANSFSRPKDLKLAGMKKNCEVCRKVVLDHSKNHHSFEIHSELCQICRHIKMITKSSMALTCPVCKKKFENKYRVEDHIDTHCQDNKYSCDQCSKKFPTNFVKQRHIDIIHGDEKTEFFCDLCESKFTLECNLKRHKENCHSEETVDYICFICESKFKRSDNLYQHSREVHNINDRKQIFKGINDQGDQFPCLTCGSIFKVRSKLERHIKTVHASIPSFACDVCDETFSRKDNLKRHVDQAHANEGAVYECETCKKTFTRREHLNRHKLTCCS